MFSPGPEYLYTASPKHSGNQETYETRREGTSESDTSSQNRNTGQNVIPVSQGHSQDTSRSGGEDKTVDTSLLQRQRIPYAVPGMSLHHQGNGCPSPASHFATPSTTPQSFQHSLSYSLQYTFDTSTQGELQFILEKRKGVFDHAHPVSRKEFWKLKLSDVFELVSNRSGQPLAKFSSLALRFQWGGRDVVVVEKSLSDQYWQEMKERMKNEFLTAKERKKSDIIKFQIWIETGDEA
jgi:hypothetical protein